MIFFRRVNDKGETTGLEERINFAVFPSTQGGPHNNTIAGVAVALKQASTPSFVSYCRAVRSNAEALAEALKSYGYRICTDGTDNHIVLWDLRPQKLTGSKMEKICEMVHITINKNSVAGDQSAMTPGGVRLGTPALTTRGFKEDDFRKTAEFLHRTVQIALSVQRSCSSKLLKDFLVAAQGNSEIQALADDVDAFASQFPLPGILGPKRADKQFSN